MANEIKTQWVDVPKFDVQDMLELEDGELSPTSSAKLLQKAINDGSPWKLQGSYGRSMMEAIKDGVCMLGPKPSFDAYNNRIPARGEVQEGTKGSRNFVATLRGEEWVKMLESVEHVNSQQLSGSAKENSSKTPRP